VLFALNKDAARAAQNEFQKRTVTKTYIALCQGKPLEQEFTVKCYLKKKKKVEEVFSGGDFSETRFVVLASATAAAGGSAMSLVGCWPKTGRMHQIRVHLAMQGSPIIGDTLYDGAKLGAGERPFYLHATKLCWLGREVRCPLDGFFTRQIAANRLQIAAEQLATI
jgi:23S rRNA-/tRNA-specific pseudouridylate synthase